MKKLSILHNLIHTIQTKGSVTTNEALSLYSSIDDYSSKMDYQLKVDAIHKASRKLNKLVCRFKIFNVRRNPKHKYGMILILNKEIRPIEKEKVERQYRIYRHNNPITKSIDSNQINLIGSNSMLLRINYPKLKINMTNTNLLERKWYLKTKDYDNNKQLKEQTKLINNSLIDYHGKTINQYVYFDCRGRMYNSNYPYSFQSDKHTRANFELLDSYHVKDINNLKIEIMNNLKQDKLNYEDKIALFDKYEDEIISSYKNNVIEYEEYEAKLKSSIKAYIDTIANKAINYIASIDATSSGTQLISILLRDHKMMEDSNVGLDDTNRKDIYSKVQSLYESKYGKQDNIDRKTWKNCLMQYEYKGLAKLKEVFGKDSYTQFISILDEHYPSINKYLSITDDVFQKAFDKGIRVLSWEMPDGFKVRIPLKLKHSYKCISFWDTKLSFYTIARNYTNESKKYKNKIYNENCRMLASNLIHSIDGYVNRMVNRDCRMIGISLISVHDSFYTNINNLEKVRQIYNKYITQIYHSTMLEDICSMILGEPYNCDLNKLNKDYKCNNKYSLC